MRNFPGCHKGQGATEYLVLLAVVLIVALVSVALLGFFPGMASDAQVTQSKIYWSSASPIMIVETGARYVNPSIDCTVIYLRIRNTGTYPITITKILAGNQSTANVWNGGWLPEAPISQFMSNLQPGEERVFGNNKYGYIPGLPDLGVGNDSWNAFAGSDGGPYSSTLKNAAQTLCSRTAPYGYLMVNSFGFEYTVTIEGQTLTKRQVGVKPLVIQCMNNYN